LGIGSTATKRFDKLFSGHLILVCGRGSNVSIINMLDTSTSGLPGDEVLQGNPLGFLKIFLSKQLL